MTAPVPTSLVWEDDAVTGAAVWVNGGLVEVTLPDGWSGRLTPSEALVFADGLAAAVAEAGRLAARWDATTGTYRSAVTA